MLQESPTSKAARGERYTVKVPDTLDLAGRMSLSINALTKVWYPDEQWALGFLVDYSRRPAILYPSHIMDAYLNIPPKFLEALTLCRLATGNTDDLDVDLEVMRVQLGLLNPNGLTFCPENTLPQFDEKRPFADVWAEGRLLIALSTIMQVDDDARWAAIAMRKVDALLARSKEKDGFRFLWSRRFHPGIDMPHDAEEPDGVGYMTGAVGHGSGLLYQITGYEPALELSRGLAHWAMARIFKNADGHYDHAHFHHGLYSLIALCQYGLAADDREVLERVDACYRWAREMGDPMIGFYCEVMPGSPAYLSRRGNSVEICEVADMVVLALWLTRAGLGDYWDDVDRWVRNMYSEGQVRTADFLDDIPDSYFVTDPATHPYPDTREIPQRSVGSFLFWMRANEGLTVDQTDEGPKLRHAGIAHCCTANGARTFYYVWDSIVTRRADEVRVNLLLNRASQWLDVDSYIPVEGKIVLHIKDAPKVAVRIPEWCDPNAVRVEVNGEDRRALIEGRYVKIGRLKSGDAVTLKLPVPERIVHRVIGEIPYKLTVRGSTVMSIDPKGVALPLFCTPPTAKPIPTTRFISDVGRVVW